MGDYKWIALNRKFDNSSFYDDSNAVQVFLHIFLNAQREDKSYFDQIIMRGQFRTSIKDMMDFLQISRKTVRRALDKLTAANAIQVLSLRRNGVLITVRWFSNFLSLENMRGGWVKLYYDLDYQDFFVNAKVLHVYLHILLHTYSENENYEDPSWFDLKKMSVSTGIPVTGIKESLMKLRKLGILNVGYNGQKRVSSVRLLEFAEYVNENKPTTSIGPSIVDEPAVGIPNKSETSLQVGATTAYPINVGTKEGQKETNRGPKEEQQVRPQNHYNKVTDTPASIEYTDIYRFVGQKEGQKRDERGPLVETANVPPNVQGGAYARDPIKKENREERVESYHYYNYSPTRKFSSIEELMLDDEWVSSMQELYGFPDKGALYNALALFLANLKCRKEEVPKGMDAFLDYFCNWYKRNEKTVRHKLKAPVSAKEYGKALWGKCMAAFSKIVCEGVLKSVFQQVHFESFDNTARALILRVPSKQLLNTLEDEYLDTVKNVLYKFFGSGIKVSYRIV